jgi:hypothetical protein
VGIAMDCRELVRHRLLRHDARDRSRHHGSLLP